MALYYVQEYEWVQYNRYIEKENEDYIEVLSDEYESIPKTMVMESKEERLEVTNSYMLDYEYNLTEDYILPIIQKVKPTVVKVDITREG